MKEKELLKAAKCGICGKGIGESGLPFFYRIRLERWGVMADAVRRQMGLTMMLGSSQLAAVMGPDEDMAKAIMQPRELTVCEPCSMKRTVVAELAEKAKPIEGEEEEP